MQIHAYAEMDKKVKLLQILICMWYFSMGVKTKRVVFSFFSRVESGTEMTPLFLTIVALKIQLPFLSRLHTYYR